MISRLHGNLERSHGEREFEGLKKDLWGGVDGEQYEQEFSQQSEKGIGENISVVGRRRQGWECRMGPYWGMSSITREKE